jgi:hypothetical protein
MHVKNEAAANHNERGLEFPAARSYLSFPRSGQLGIRAIVGMTHRP